MQWRSILGFLFLLNIFVFITLFSYVNVVKNKYNFGAMMNNREIDVIEKKKISVPGGSFDFILNSNVAITNITILMWTDYYGNKDLVEHIINESPIPAWCNVTFNKDALSESDAIVFHVTDLNLKELPPRNLAVPWVFFVIEAPIYIGTNIKELNGMFNRTMTYRLDSDYPTPYGFLEIRSEPLLVNPVLESTFPKKTKLIAWMVSHCSTISNREALVAAMKKYVNVDIYGGCGKLFCEKTEENMEEDCYGKLGNEYLFYLSFENSLCKDYITEKFSNALKHNMVPIVFGGGNYSSILPMENSYIDVRDFSSAKQLTDYLKYLYQNRTAYAEYFEWRKLYTVKSRQGFNGFKKMCYALQRGEAQENQIYENLFDWWSTDANCPRGLNFKWSDV